MAKQIPLNVKYTLSINEAAAYFGIGIKKMRSMAEDNVGDAFLFTGNRFMVLRPIFENYLNTLAKKKREKQDEQTYFGR